MKQAASRHVLLSHVPHPALCLKLYDGKKHTHKGNKEQEKERLQMLLESTAHYLGMVGTHVDQKNPIYYYKTGHNTRWTPNMKTTNIENNLQADTKNIFIFKFDF